MNRKSIFTLLSVILILSFVLTSCSQPTPTPAPVPTKAPAPAATVAPAPTAAPAATKAPEATKAPAPTAAPASKFKEAPILADQVKAGKLPAVDQRLPENPYVISAPEIGQYGGIWHRGFTGPSDFNGLNRIINDSLVRFSIDGASVEMKYAESVTPNANNTEWTIKLRKGSKWSDGSPFTADDIMFWFKDVVNNKDLMPALPSWLVNQDKSPVKVEKVDDLSVKFTFATPFAFFLEQIAQADFGDKVYPMFLPAKYMKQFHASYADKAALDKLVVDNKLKTWTELFAAKQNPFDNPERPTMAAWMASNRYSEPIFVMKRNPYYVGVDKAGNQLPYIDEVQVKFFADVNALNLAAIAGELDEQERHIQLTNYPTLKETSQKSGKYDIYLWSSTGGDEGGVIFNLTYQKDPELTAMWTQLDFRKAVSYAIDRKEIQESIFLGTGEPRMGIIKKTSSWYPGDEWAYKYTEYKPDEANKLLDALGYTKRDAEGYRLLPSGKRVGFELSAVSTPLDQVPPAQLIVRHLKKVGIWVDLRNPERDLHFQMRQANELQAEIWNQDSAGTMFSGSTKYDIRLPIFGNLTYGPLWKDWYDSNGAKGVEPPAPWKKIVALQDEAKSASRERLNQIAQEIYKIWVDNLYDIGTVGLTAKDQGVAVVSKNLRNVPKDLTKDWALRTPGNGKPEVWFFVK
ncbi:MAG: ABC transporter substrate-binding protein [Chloroflexi bacterium]|nr:ABC transporter substrate-binding protein [Chloroflexota bacterium]